MLLLAPHQNNKFGKYEKVVAQKIGRQILNNATLQEILFDYICFKCVGKGVAAISYDELINEYERKTGKRVTKATISEAIKGLVSKGLIDYKTNLMNGVNSIGTFRIRKMDELKTLFVAFCNHYMDLGLELVYKVKTLIEYTKEQIELGLSKFEDVLNFFKKEEVEEVQVQEITTVPVAPTTETPQITLYNWLEDEITEEITVPVVKNEQIVNGKNLTEVFNDTKTVHLNVLRNQCQYDEKEYEENHKITDLSRCVLSYLRTFNYLFETTHEYGSVLGKHVREVLLMCELDLESLVDDLVQAFEDNDPEYVLFKYQQKSYEFMIKQKTDVNSNYHDQFKDVEVTLNKDFTRKLSEFLK